MSIVKSLLKAFNQKPIVIYPVYIKLTGDHASAAALAQIVYWHEVKGGEFYKTDVEFESELSLKKDQFVRVKKVLKSLPFLTIKLKQVPPKTFYSLDYDLLGSAISRVMAEPNLWENPEIELGENPEIVARENPEIELGENPENITENTYREYTENINIYKGKEGKTRKLKTVDKFVEPTVEVVNQYAVEMKAVNFDAAVFIDYYKANGWMVGKHKMKDWKATVRNWLRRNQTNQNGGGHETNQTTGNGGSRKQSPTDAVAAACGYPTA